MAKKNKIKVLISKVGLDGHDRGAKVVASLLKEAGMEVIYLGMYQTPENIVKAAIDEDVDVIGLSILSGAHLPIAQKLIKKLKDKGISDIPVVIGGVIPKKDIPLLKSYGVAEVCAFGTPLTEIVECIPKVARHLTN